jgi:hypothetical protein
MPWLNAPGVRFSSAAARLKLPQRAAASNRRKPLSGGSLIAMRQQPLAYYDENHECRLLEFLLHVLSFHHLK